jgi:hypothetical protein
MYTRQQPDYILLDQNIGRITTNAELQQRYAALLARLAGSEEYERVWQRGEYLLLSRRSTP